MTLIQDSRIDEEGPVLPRFSCGCESCKIRRAEGTKLKNAVVHSYSYKPRNWAKKSVKNDPFSYFLGVELETDNFYVRELSLPRQNVWGDHIRSERVSSQVRVSMAADMRRPKNLWSAKRDGSVTGPEFVSHPATLTYWRKNRKALEEMFEMLLHAGYRSHDNDKCGMHINISREAFEESTHLYRFVNLINFSHVWSRRMAQRTISSTSWAKLYRRSAGTWRNICKNAYTNPSWYETTDKYEAVNMPPASQGRFEFRLPRGTLRIDRFFKNLEWTVAMIEFTRNASVLESRPITFMKWVMDREKEYPYLAAFLTERSPKLQAATERA